MLAPSRALGFRYLKSAAKKKSGKVVRMSVKPQKTKGSTKTVNYENKTCNSNHTLAEDTFVIVINDIVLFKDTR